MNLNVDKSQWTKVRLGDVATEYSSRINDPSSGDRERFVGSSCIGQWDFRVQEWESTESVTSAMKLFEEGDYLLVRRSLYASDFRERAPRAHFAGVCSGDILTIRENPELIADGFLIGILNNPSIWSYIVANASGSITRRIKWKDLANYEFLLPPKDQQAEIAELLWALDGMQTSHSYCLTALLNTIESNRNQFWQDVNIDVRPLEELCSEPICYGIVQPGPEQNEGVPFIQSSDVRGGGVNVNSLRLTSFDIASKYGRSSVKEGDMVISLRGNIGDIAIVPSHDGELNLARGVAKLVIDSKRDTLILYQAMQSSLFRNRIVRQSQGSTFKEISIDSLRRIKVPSCEDASWVDWASSIAQLCNIKEDVERHLVGATRMRSAILNQVFTNV